MRQSCRFLSAVGTGWRQVSEDLRRHRLRELGAASRTGLPHALRSYLAVETERLSLEERLPHPVGRGVRDGPARTSNTSAVVREVRSVCGSAAGGADAFEARAGTKTGEQGRRVSDTVCHFRLVGFHVGSFRSEIQCPRGLIRASCQS